MNKLKLPDAYARRKIITDLKTTFLVEAGAGSGKTKSLVDRMLALLAAGECKIDNIAAVTFTRKAAAELRGRFQTELERTIDGMKKSESKERLDQALHLLEQSFIAGLGNIYVDEALWFAKLHPQQSGLSVSRKKSEVLHGAIQRLLQTAIENQGTTIINFYFGEGKKGNFSEQLQVFGRQEQACPRCDTIIEKIRVAQRGTHICPRCQKL